MSVLIIIAKIAFVFIVFCIGVVMGGKAVASRVVQDIEAAVDASSLTDEQRVEIAELFLEQVEKRTGKKEKKL